MDTTEDCSHACEDECRRHAAEVLASRVFVIGCGAFQNLWDKKTPRTVGFGSAGETVAVAPEQQDLGSIIPLEVTNRFVTPALVLPPLGEKDYRALVRQACAVLPAKLAAHVAKSSEDSIAEAVEQGLGCRWIERLLLEALTAEDVGYRLRHPRPSH
jgi:hypothetical protein